jgi:hypothetical protein
MEISANERIIGINFCTLATLPAVAPADRLKEYDLDRLR